MKYLKAEKQTSQYYFQVHMDETKNLPDGMPDPVYVRDYSYVLLSKLDGTFDNTKGFTNEDDYEAMMKREIGLLVADELVGMATPTPIPTPLVGF